ncbi:MAG: STAS domain-containing protein [Acidimicrobiales bacterium]|nr:STAS domain-containing protein [Acidimicrobiales bacterium]
MTDSDLDLSAADLSETSAAERASLLTIDVSVVGNVAVIYVQGEIDQFTVPLLRDALTSATTAHPVVAVDMSAVDFIDSSGLGALIGAYKQADERSGTVRVRKPSDEVRRLLRITGQTDRFLEES